MAIRVVIVDDDEMVRRGLALFLELNDDFEMVGAAGDGEVGLELCMELVPDVVLTEIELPLVDGIMLTRVLTKIFPRMKIVVLDMFRQPKAVEALLRAGVSQYLIKEIGFDELAQAIREVVKDNGCSSEVARV